MPRLLRHQKRTFSIANNKTANNNRENKFIISPIPKESAKNRADHDILSLNEIANNVCSSITAKLL